jgi:hypothetical protein
MVRINNLKADNTQKVLRRIARTATTPPLDSASVHNGRTRFVGLLSLIVEGSQLVSGLLYIAGTLRAIGAVFLDGITTITGILNQNGPWNLAGDGGITGDVIHTGKFRIRAGGEIEVEGGIPLVLGMTPNGPGLEFGNGTDFAGGPGGALIRGASGTAVGINLLSAVMSAGSNSVTVSLLAGTTTNGPATFQDGVKMTGIPKKAVAGVPANLLWIDPGTFVVYQTL